MNSLSYFIAITALILSANVILYIVLGLLKKRFNS